MLAPRHWRGRPRGHRCRPSSSRRNRGCSAASLAGGRGGRAWGPSAGAVTVTAAGCATATGGGRRRRRPRCGWRRSCSASGWVDRCVWGWLAGWLVGVSVVYVAWPLSPYRNVLLTNPYTHMCRPLPATCGASKSSRPPLTWAASTARAPAASRPAAPRRAVAAKRRRRRPRRPRRARCSWSSRCGSRGATTSMYVLAASVRVWALVGDALMDSPAFPPPTRTHMHMHAR